MRTIGDVLRDYEKIMSLRTRYEGQEPRDDDLLVAEITRLRLRERQCDATCGADQSAASGWYRARDEFDLNDDGPYEAIKRLRGQVAALRNALEALANDAGIAEPEPMHPNPDAPWQASIHPPTVKLARATLAATAPEGGE